MDAQESVRTKVMSVMREMAGDRAERLTNASAAAGGLGETIAAAMAEGHGDSAADIGFHLSDWNEDAAFLIALSLFPERSSAEEVRTGVINLIIHAPNHMAAAAKLAGYPIQDAFGLGAFVEEPD